MTQADPFIRKLESLKEGERSRLRRLAGQPLDHAVPGFDLFTGLWWPLREKSAWAPRRETSWLVAKLFGVFPLPHVPSERDGPTTLAFMLGSCEPKHPACPDAALLSSVPPQRDPAKRQFIDARRFRLRFDALLQTPLSGLEPHLRWALWSVGNAIQKEHASGFDWVQLLDDLSKWDRGAEYGRTGDVRDQWAEQYLNATSGTKGVEHVG